MDVISRAAAKERGLLRYFTGVPCKHGHVAERFVSSNVCIPCGNARSLKQYEKNREQRNAYNKGWLAANATQRREQRKQRYAEERESSIAAALEWAKENKARKAANNACRRARKLLATPPWADLKAIQQFYMGCPSGYHVDHIVPLQGETVCGLHTLANLQYLPASENISKGNRMPECL